MRFLFKAFTLNQTLLHMETTFAIDQVMVRYDLDKAHRILYSYDALKQLDVNHAFIMQLLDLFENEASFKAENFDAFSLAVIVDYIQKTHHYYLSKKLLEIEQNITLLLKDYESQHPLLAVLHNFYTRYHKHLADHIQEEEAVLLPYILALESKNLTITNSFKSMHVGFSLQHFIESHHDVEDDLNVARQAILKYNPPATNSTPYRILLSQLQALEKDLAIHALIEDHVLIPRALQLERDLYN